MDNITPVWYNEILDSKSDIKKEIALCGNSLGPSVKGLVEHMNRENGNNVKNGNAQLYWYAAEEKSTEVALYIGKLLTKKDITIIHLMYSDFGDEELRIIVENFHNNMSIKGLGFINCKITDEGASVLVKALMNNFCLECVVLDKTINKSIINEIDLLTDRNKNFPKIIYKSIPVTFILGILDCMADNLSYKCCVLPREIIYNIVYYVFLLNLYNYKPTTVTENILDLSMRIKNNLNRLLNNFLDLF